MDSLRQFLNIIPVCSTLELLDGEKLFDQGQPTRGLFLIEQGQIQLRRDTIDGNSVLLYTAQTGETLAEASLFSDNYHCVAQAISTSTVLHYEKKAILQTLQSNPDYAQLFIKLLAKQVQQFRSLIEIRSIKSPQQRRTQFLVVNIDSDKQLTLPSTYKDFAIKLGMSHETLYRDRSMY